MFYVEDRRLLMEWSFPWLSIDGDRSYDDTDFSKFFEGLFSYGVSLTTADALRVSASPNGGMQVQVAAGYSFTGKVFLNSDDKALNIDVASSMQDRTDSVVVRMDKSVRNIFLVVKKNDVSVTRAADVYELQLATVRVPRNTSSITANLITDKRADYRVCGYSSPFQKVSVSGLEDQYTTLLQAIIAKMNQYTEVEKSKFEADMATIITAGNNKMNDFTALFYDWFNNLKNQLDGNQAAKLQNQIQLLTADTELATIEHTLTDFPMVRALAWDYGAGVAPIGQENTGAGGGHPITIPVNVEYLSRKALKVHVPMEYGLINPTYTKIDERHHRFISGFKTIEISLGGI